MEIKKYLSFQIRPGFNPANKLVSVELAKGLVKACKLLVIVNFSIFLQHDKRLSMLTAGTLNRSFLIKSAAVLHKWRCSKVCR